MVDELPLYVLGGKSGNLRKINNIYFSSFYLLGLFKEDMGLVVFQVFLAGFV